MIKKYIPLFICTLFLFSACDMLDIKPTGKVIPTTLAEYRALLSSAYNTVPDVTGMACFRSDEMFVKNDSWEQNRYGKIERWDDFSARGETTPFEWKNFYTVMFTANYTIEKRNDIKEGSPEDLDQLIGECYLLRAYMHFFLVNLYGEPYTRPGAPDTKAIPLKLNSDINQMLKRNTVGEVYASILSDIDEAEKLISKESWEAKFSYRFTKNSVLALRARTNLYMGNWSEANKAAEAILAKKNTLEDFNVAGYKLPNNYLSVESLTALELPMTSNYNQAAYASASLLSTYQDGDLRRDAYFKAPDKNGNRVSLKGGRDEFRCSFRVGEIYLIAAESAAHLGKLPEAKARLSALMQKRYTAQRFAVQSAALNTMSKEALLQEVLTERERELAFEGHRWFDLRRTTRPRIEKVLDGKTYVLEQDDKRYTIQIPQEAIEANPGLNS